MGMQVGKKKGRFVAEINITPFVDVMLVLLIIFMVTTPMMQEGIDIDLPQTREVDTLPTETQNLVLSIKRDGSIYIDTYQVNFNEISTRLAALVESENKAVYLQADKDVAFDLVVRVMGEIKSAGISDIGIVARRSEINLDENETIEGTN